MGFGFDVGLHSILDLTQRRGRDEVTRAGIQENRQRKRVLERKREGDTDRK
jgi:hypothetical protein